MITLVLGGARSGKSAIAERLVARLPEPVTYLATAAATDPEMTARIAAHRARRPSHWRTVEAGEKLAEELAAVDGSVLVDALGPWVARSPDFRVDLDAFCRELDRRGGDSVVVSEEVGLGVHPSTQAGRQFRDSLGEVNQAVAAIADDVLLVVAGRTLALDPP